jgi:hypothetical protein
LGGFFYFKPDFIAKRTLVKGQNPRKSLLNELSIDRFGE